MHAVEMIGHMEKPTMKALATRLGITMGSLTVMIDRLEKLELATRQSNPEDRRSYVIVLKTLGETYFAEHERRHLALTEELCVGLEPCEEQQLVALFEKIIDRF
jgi:DNA-binding MarR family transcriptional regulator